MNNIAKPGCQTHCGNVAVPYPFGIGKDTGCSLDDSLYLSCNTSFDPPKLYLPSFKQDSVFEIHNISDSELRVFTNVGSKCYDQYGNLTNDYDSVTGLFNGFTFSEKNKFTVIGCDDIVVIQGSGVESVDPYASSCLGFCTELSDVVVGECSGNGCCQTSITKGLRNYNVVFRTLKRHQDVWRINDCGYAFLGEQNTFRFGGASDLSNSSNIIQRVESSVLVVIDWVIRSGFRNCSQATECKENSECYDADSVRSGYAGYSCRCNQGYEGNTLILIKVAKVSFWFRSNL
ncbi:wall-associated receptor kinase 2-like protein [Tanacetum coccineum]